MKKAVTPSFGLVEALIVVIFVGAVSFAGLYTYQTKHETKNASNPAATVQITEKTVKNSTVNQQATSSAVQDTTNSNSDAVANSATTTTQTPAAFDIESFYNKIQNGMTLNQVKNLANGQSYQCAQTGSINSGPTCIWKSGSKTVYVSFNSGDTVIGKNKDGF